MDSKGRNKVEALLEMIRDPAAPWTKKGKYRVMNEFRKDLISGRWIITGDLGPEDFFKVIKDLEPRPVDLCPFCGGAEDQTMPEVFAVRPDSPAPNTPGWMVRVTPSSEPYLRIEGDLGRKGEGVHDRMNNIGAHELVIETPRHVKNMCYLPNAQVAWTLLAFQARIRDLAGDPRFRYTLVFKNQRPAQTTRFGHAHSHILSLPSIPIGVKNEIENAQRYYSFKDRCLFCDVIRQELETGERIVETTDHYVAFVPFAASFPFETWIMPIEHNSDFGGEPESNLDELGALLRRSLLRLDIGLDDPPLNFVLHSAPYDRKNKVVWNDIHQGYHWHLEILPHVKETMGYEWGSGEKISLIAPETAAQYLKEADLHF